MNCCVYEGGQVSNGRAKIVFIEGLLGILIVCFFCISRAWSGISQLANQKLKF